MEQRLFGDRPGAGRTRRTAESRWHTGARGLMPLAAAGMLCLILLGPRLGQEGGLHGLAPGRVPGLASLSNQFYAAYLADPLHSHQNASPTPRIGWTNSRASSTSVASFWRLGTNHPGQ